MLQSFLWLFTRCMDFLIISFYFLKTQFCEFSLMENQWVCWRNAISLCIMRYVFSSFLGTSQWILWTKWSVRAQLKFMSHMCTISELALLVHTTHLHGFEGRTNYLGGKLYKHCDNIADKVTRVKSFMLFLWRWKIALTRSRHFLKVTSLKDKQIKAKVDTLFLHELPWAKNIFKNSQKFLHTILNIIVAKML